MSRSRKKRDELIANPKRIPHFPWLLAGCVVLFLFTRFYLLFVLKPQLTDVGLYFQYAARALDAHETPYTAAFQVEYPPVALWSMIVPYYCCPNHVVNPNNMLEVDTCKNSFADYFRGFMFLYDAACFAMMLFIVSRRNKNKIAWATLAYVLSTAILSHLIYDRLDLCLLFFIMLTAFFWQISLDSTKRPLFWTALSYLALGLSISYKLIPVIAVPFLLLSEWHVPRRWPRLASGLTALGLGIAIPFTIQYLISGPGVFDLFEHHAKRGIQLESLYSTLMMIGSIFGKEVLVTHGDGAYNLSGDLGPAMKILSQILLIGFLACMGLWCLWRWKRYSRNDAFRMICLIIPAAVILSNVLSPQYFLFAFPLMVLLAADVLSLHKSPFIPWIFLAVLLTVSGMTTFIFPYHYFIALDETFGLAATPTFPTPPTVGGGIVLAFRNFAYLGLVIWLSILLVRQIRDE